MEAITEKSGNIATVVGSGPSKDPSTTLGPCHCGRVGGHSLEGVPTG